MALDFSKASTQFIRNLVELGVCENADCLNAYHPPAAVQNRSVGAAQRPKSLYAAATAVPATAAAASTRPVIPVDVPRWCRALDSDDFPLTEVCHQLSSSEVQMSQSLENFIDDLFSAVSHRYGVQLETLVRALRLLERVQMTNIRAHNLLLLSQPSFRNGPSSSNAGSFDSEGGSLTAVGCVDSTAAMLTWSQAPVVQPRSTTSPEKPGALLHVAETSTPQLGPSSSSAPVRIAASAVNSPAFCPASCGSSACCPPPPLSVARGSAFDGSSVSSGTIGPLTDTDQHSYGKCGGVPALSSSLTSWCLPTKSPCELSMSATAAPPNAVDLPSLLSRLKLCAACAGSRVFTLQYYNVHLLLAACLALSISINEVAVMDALTEDVLMHQVAEMSHCMDLPLQMAVSVVCETLGGELCVFDSDVDALVRRLNIMETCVFASQTV